MGQPRAKVLDYELELGRDGLATAAGGAPAALPEGLSPEHLLLAALGRCTLASLAYHARRAGIAVAGTSGRLSGRVTKRETDGRYALVEAEAELAVELDPLPAGEALAELLAKAERDCFVGASLAIAPRYAWRVTAAAPR
jgi:organic hydroperoxide reductase OsmC/OhrA